MSALTLEQQKDYVRRVEEGYRYAREMDARETRERTPEQRWEIIERVQEMVSVCKEALPGEDPETHGLVEQQRLFSRLHPLR